MEKLPSVVGLAWFTAESYPRVRELFTDRDERIENFRDWLERATQVEKIKKADGFRVIRVHLDATDFPAWCRRNGRNVDSDAVADYAAEKAAEVLFRERGEHVEAP